MKKVLFKLLWIVGACVAFYVLVNLMMNVGPVSLFP